MRRRVAILAAVLVALAALIAVGRGENVIANRTQNRGIAHVLAMAGPHWNLTASAYRLAPSFDCLLYKVGINPYALELCFLPSGRIVEAIDRRDESAPTFWSLRFDPGAATVAVNPTELTRAFIAIHAIPRRDRSIPLGHADDGPVLVARHHGG